MSTTRRALLRAMGGAAAALPLLRAGLLRGQDPIGPRRLLIWFTPNGTVEEEWRPTGGEHDFVLGRILEPLEPFRRHLLLFGPQTPSDDPREHVGISLRCTEDPPSGGHGLSMLLTGRPEVEVDGETWGGGESVDQYVARHVGAATRFPSLELGVRVQGGAASVGNRMIYRGAGSPVPPEGSPHAAFDRLFSDLAAPSGAPGPDDGVERRRARRRAVLDFAHGRFEALRPRLGREDRLRLDAHRESLSELQGRLLAAPEPGPSRAACRAPEMAGLPSNGWDEYDNMPQTGELQMDLLAMAFACDLTRVASLQWNWAASNARFPWVGAGEWQHELSHEPRDDRDARDKLVRTHRWYAEQLASLLGRLDALPEGDGTVLDNTVVFWCNELSDGMYHTHQNMPFLLAGGAGGHLRTGRYVRYADRAHNDLLVSLCQAMGVDTETFGDPRFCRGALPDLT